MATAQRVPDKLLLKLSEVEALTGFRRSFIYREIPKGNFPRPRRIGSRATRWHVDDIRAWADAQPEAA